MKGLDTNVLVRYFTQDDPVQSVAAERCIQSTCTADQPGLIHAVVLCELVWVLETAYGNSRDQIVNVLGLVLRTRQLQVQDREIMREALTVYRSGKADFADAVIGQVIVPLVVKRLTPSTRRRLACQNLQLYEQFSAIA